MLERPQFRWPSGPRFLGEILTSSPSIFARKTSSSHLRASEISRIFGTPNFPNNYFSIWREKQPSRWCPRILFNLYPTKPMQHVTYWFKIGFPNVPKSYRKISSKRGTILLRVTTYCLSLALAGQKNREKHNFHLWKKHSRVEMWGPAYNGGPPSTHVAPSR